MWYTELYGVKWTNFGSVCLNENNTPRNFILAKRVYNLLASREPRVILARCIKFCIWLRPRAVHVMEVRFARDEIINSIREDNPSINSDERQVPHST